MCSKPSSPQELVPYPPDILPAMGQATGERTLPPETRRLRQLHEEERPRNVYLRLYSRR